MSRNPFVGPRPYRQDEPLFGRDAEAALLVDILVGSRVVVIQSPSGAGKSSLLEALLKPLLRERGFRLTPTCRVAWRDGGDTIPPWPGVQNPLLADACLQLLGGADVGGDLRHAVDRIEGSSEAGLEEDQGLVLVFDQCEKLFQRQRTVRSEAVLRGFFAQVADVLRHPRRIALFALRHEYRSALDGYAGLVPTGFGNTYTLDFLRCPQAREVLEKTFASRGVEVGPEAVALLVDEQRRLGTNPSCTSRTHPSTPVEDLSVFVEPLHLQAHGFRLWHWLEQQNHGHAPGRVDAGTLSGMPSVADALGDYYDETVKSVAAEARTRERDLRDWIGSELIDPSGIRRLTTKPPPGGRKATQALERLYLVRSEARNDAVWLELSHDRLAEPARARNLRRLHEFQRRAVSYAETHFEELLVDGKDLERAVAWAKANPDEINEDDSRLLADSQEAERKAARGRRQRTQLALGVLGVLVVILAGLVALSFRLNRLNNEASAARERADQALLASRSHALSQRALDLSSAGPTSDTAMLLAVQAGRFARQHMETATTSAGSGAGALAPAEPSALFQLALSVTDAAARHPASGYGSRLLGEVPGVAAAAADASGELVATGDSKGGVAVWRRTAAGWQSEGQWVGPGSGQAIGQLAMDPQGLWLAALTKVDEQAQRGGDLWLLRRVRGALSPEGSASLASGITAVAVDVDESRALIVVSGDTKGHLVVRTRAAGSRSWASQPLAPALGDKGVNAIVIGSSHRTLAAAGWGRICLWRGVDWRGGEAPRSEELIDGGEPEFARVRALALTADERELWAVGDILPQDRREAVVGTVANWDVSRAPGRLGVTYPTAEVMSTLALARGGRTVVAGALHSGSIRLWTGSVAGPPLRAHEGGTVALFDSPPGGFLSVGKDDMARLWLPPPPALRCPGGIVAGGWVGGIATLGSAGPDQVAVALTTAKGEARLDVVPMRDSELLGDAPRDGVCSPPRWTPIGGSRTAGSGQRTRWQRIPFAPDSGSWSVAVGTTDNRIVVYRVVDRALADAPQLTRFAWSAPARPADALAFVPGGERLLAASDAGIDVLRVAGTGLRSESLIAPPSTAGPARAGMRVTTLAANGSWIAAGSASPGVVWLWPASTLDAGPGASVPRELRLPKGEESDVRVVALSADGHHVAAGLSDGKVALWEIALGGDARLSRAGGGTVNALAFSPEGDLLAAASRDGVLRQWELGFEGDGHPADIGRLGTWVLESRVADGAIGALAFTPDGRAILTGGAGNAWRATQNMAGLFRDLCTLAGRNLTRREWLEFVSEDAESYQCTCPQFGPGSGIEACPARGAP
jgi:WD40 repeat protein